MTQKLFYVEVSKSAWVLAENEEEAEKFADEISDAEYFKDVDVFPYTEEYLKVSGWNECSLVYHKDQKNKAIKLGDALND
jgi:hypothetical protein